MKAIITIFYLALVLAGVEAAEELSFLQLHHIEQNLKGRAPEKVLPTELRDYHHTDIIMKGYLFESPGGDWILASKPGLKSCCIGAEKNVFKQVYIDASNPPRFHNELVNVKGEFAVEVLKNTEGQYVRVYSIKDAKIAPLKTRKLPVFTVVSIACVGLFFYARRRMRRHQSK